MMQIQRGEIAPETLVHIERVAGIGDIYENGRLNVGALATHLDLAHNLVLVDRYRSISHAASLVGGWQTQALEDNWTVVTADGSLSAHFENTLVITEGDAEVLTRL